MKNEAYQLSLKDKKNPYAREQSIGVFDSGVGGLTVLKALIHALPDESFIYLADTARLPYGTKSADSIRRYTLQCTRLLIDKGIKLLVVACNTASSVALDYLRENFPDTPIIGVIEPGAMAAVETTKNHHVAVIGTEGTIRQGAYEKALKALNPDIRVHSLPCQLLVALAEEGWHDGVLVESIVDRYLTPLIHHIDGFKPDALVLGCTHFPVLREAIQAVVGENVVLVDSAQTTAKVVRHFLNEHHLQAEAGKAVLHHFLATEGPERFAKLASKFLGVSLTQDDIELVDL